MYRPPRGHPALAEKKVLLIDRFRATREARAAVLRTHAVEVHEAEEFSGAHFVMLDVRRYSQAEALEFYEQIRAPDPRQRIVFLTDPPKYLSRTWSGEFAEGDTSRGRLSETGQALFGSCLRLSSAARGRK